MPSFEISQLQPVSASRSLSETDRSQISSRSPASNAGEGVGAKPGVALEVNTALDPSQPPVSSERVSEIRKALQDGTYPLVPTKIADAIIAARLSFGVETK